ncbi:hypothetical protein GXW83_06955 [Streptacidiphilus sp. PB12-B1b]|uniref:hypothetical protein n=1 Tax=Streptacidiphilus sp. PB12-B1b TaxID=2705012 RepID=UPI0015FDC044|nr:hypothetical protein [Streptacidiphilus sp. PB12-B1b]QMU74396.1 hypothetical protein GXW83_06955 [Streptacidiphilus sp. PB12-B1b]
MHPNSLAMPAQRQCPACDGFPIVAVTTSTRRRPDGTLPTLHTACPDCHGTGTHATASTRALASR